MATTIDLDETGMSDLREELVDPDVGECLNRFACSANYLAVEVVLARTWDDTTEDFLLVGVTLVIEEIVDREGCDVTCRFTKDEREKIRKWLEERANDSGLLGNHVQELFDER